MSDEEFIEAYVQGRIPRRTFVRKLVAGGLSLGAALAYGTALAPAAAADSRDSRQERRRHRGDHHNHHDHHDHHDHCGDDRD